MVNADTGWLVGGGEITQLIRELDWTATPLGPIATWSPSLRTAVSIVLGCPSPALLVWGPGHTQIYNQAYRQLIDQHHPAAMGTDYRVRWAAFFPAIGAAYQQAWDGGTAEIPELRTFLEREGYMQEGWASLSWSPIRGDGGAVAGLFHLIVDQSQTALAIRRRRTLIDLSTHVSQARTTPEAYAVAMRVLGEAALDVPFVLLYDIADDGGQAVLIGQHGVPLDGDVRPARVERGAADDRWRIAAVMATGTQQPIELGGALAGLAVGPYPEAPRRAVAVPLHRPGSDRPSAVLVLGQSARLPDDDAYRTFCTLIGATVASAITNARAYEESQARLEAMAELDRAKTAFFSNVSHELRTPLTLILAPLDDARRRGAALFGERLELVHRSSLRLLRLVNDLLDFARIEAGRLVSTFTPTDLALVTAAHAEAFRSLVEPAGLTLTIDCPPLDEPIYVDRDHWEKIVTNLVGNAFKFTLAGGIAVRLRAADGKVELRVADTGAGIPAHELSRVFERFHRVEGTVGRTIEGSGIGLSLVSELVREHRGTIDVISELDVGSTFVVSLAAGTDHLPPERVRSAPPGDPPVPSSRASVIGGSVRTRRITAPVRSLVSLGASEGRQRILIADDNDDMRDYLISVLGPLWEVEGVTNGRVALARALAEPPELVLTDVMMPELDGLGLVRALRADPRTAATPVVLLSARAGEESVIDALELGANDYLVKPFSSRELVSRIRTHLETARLRRELVAGALELDAIVENLPHMLFVKDAERLAFTRINRAGELLLGIDRAQMLGKNDHDFFPPEQAEFFIAKDRETLNGTAPVDIVEEPIATPSGRRWLHTKKVPIYDNAGRPRFLLGISEDITERRHQQEELMRAKDAAEQANRELESFSYSVAHDLRAPLRAIDGFAQALTDDYADRLDDDGRRYLRFVRESAQRMGTLIDDLLDLSRVTRSEVVRQPVDLSALVQVVIVRLARTAPERSVQVEVEAGLTIDADPHLIAVVLDNLLGNAWKFTRRRPDARIEVGQVATDAGDAYFVRDNGAGFDEAYADKLFGVFQRLHSQADFEGTGVGLATVQRIIRRHGGKLWAHGKVGDGATFYFSLHDGSRAHE